MKQKIKEVIIVEGRDDESAVKAAVEAEIIVTRGFHIAQKTWELMKKAEEGPGILVFTDPDHAGERIRARIRERFPNAKHAFLSREEARNGDDIGIENASQYSIVEALKKARCTKGEETAREELLFRMEDLYEFSLVGGEGASARRNELGKQLGIGYGNAKTFLNRLNHYGITKEEYQTYGKTLFTGDDSSDHE